MPTTRRIEAVASIPDLIYPKKLAGRPRDRDDIEKLEAIARLKESNEAL